MTACWDGKNIHGNPKFKMRGMRKVVVTFSTLFFPLWFRADQEMIFWQTHILLSVA